MHHKVEKNTIFCKVLLLILVESFLIIIYKGERRVCPILKNNYSQNHMDYTAAVLKNIYDSRDEAKTGYRIIDEAPIMRHFTVKFEKI